MDVIDSAEALSTGMLEISPHEWACCGDVQRLWLCRRNQERVWGGGY